MDIYFFDTRQRKKVKFAPLAPGFVKMYTCGPTVYDVAHIGNFRTYVFEDLLRRILKHFGYEILQAMNITDVDDKTIKKAKDLNVSLESVTQPIIDRFFEDLEILKIERAEHYPKATEHVEEMIDLIKMLIDKGYAYEMGNSIYFRIEKYPEYGRLSGMKLDRLNRGVRIDADEYEKGDFRDFALWKGYTDEDGKVVWEAPFGKGRPGWHIECSAMSRKYLGEEFDIHTGGVDNIFPHHENEIAQSICATEKSFARYWLHSEHLIVEGEKMSKSLGNFYSLRDLLEKGYTGRAIRYTLLTTHYRQRLNLSMDALSAANASLARLDTLKYTAQNADKSGDIRPAVKEIITKARKRFDQNLADDLGIAGAMSALFNMVSEVHRLEQERYISKEEAKSILEFWSAADRVLGFLFTESSALPDEIREIILERQEARKSKNFARSDEIRDYLVSQGFQIEDAREGTIIIWKEGRETVK